MKPTVHNSKNKNMKKMYTLAIGLLVTTAANAQSIKTSISAGSTNLRTLPTTITPCYTANVAWLTGGNDLGTVSNAALGTCNSADLVFETSGINHLWLKTSGFLGAGTSSPDAALSVATSTASSSAFDVLNGSTNMFNIATNGNTSINANAANSNPALSVNGVSTTSVVAKFSNNTYSTFFMVNSPGGGVYNPLVKAGDNALIFDDGTGGGSQTKGFVIGAWNEQGTHGIRIDGLTGNVGIGINTPTACLTIQTTSVTTHAFSITDGSNTLFNVENNGTATVNGNLVVDIGGPTINNSYDVVFGSAAGQALNYGSSYIGFNAQRVPSTGSWTKYGDGAHNGAGIIFGNVFGDMCFAPVPNNSGSNTTFADADVMNYKTMQISWNTNIGAGQVFIGKYSQKAGSHTNALLQVNGDVIVGTGSSANIFVSQQNWSDFVFDKNYQLMPLNELETFYKQEHHLPNVPTTQQIQEQGNNLGQTDAVLLQKIEENTLYIVELKKQLEAQQQLIEAMSKKMAEQQK